MRENAQASVAVSRMNELGWSMPAIVTCAGLLLIVGLSKLSFGSYLAPAGFFSGLWCLPAGALGLVGGHLSFSWRAAAVILGLHLLFFIGTVLGGVTVYGLESSRAARAPRPVSLVLQSVRCRERALLPFITTVFSLAGIAGAFLLLYSIAVRYGSLVQMLSQAGTVRADIIEYGTGAGVAVRGLLVFNFCAAVCGGALWAIRPRARLIAWLPIVGVLVANTAGFGRAGFVMSGLLYGGAFVIGRQMTARPIRPGEALRLGIVAIVVGGGFFTAVQIARYEGNLDRDRLQSTMAQRYQVYSFGSLAGLSAYLQEPSRELFFGRAAFAAILELVNAVGVPVESEFNRYYEGTNIGNDGYSTNIFTFIRPIHEDLGWAGMCVMFAGMGVGSGICFQVARRVGLLPPLCVLAGVYAFLAYGLITSAGIYMSWVVATTLPAVTFVIVDVGLLLLKRKEGHHASPDRGRVYRDRFS